MDNVPKEQVRGLHMGMQVSKQLIFAQRAATPVAAGIPLCQELDISRSLRTMVAECDGGNACGHDGDGGDRQ